MLITMLLAIMFIYPISPLPAKVVVTVSILLTGHVMLGMVQPGWQHHKGKLLSWSNCGPALITIALIWGIAIYKLQLRKGVP